MNSKLTFNFENLYVGVCYEQMPKLVSVRLLSDFMGQWYFAAHTISQLLTSKKSFGLEDCDLTKNWHKN